jgi:hypothetical protein
LWLLAVVDKGTGAALNTDGRLTLCGVQNGTVLQLFASDKDDTTSEWFVAGQRYVAMAYLEGGRSMTADISLP